MRILTDHTRWIFAIAKIHSPVKSPILASSIEDQTIRLWNVEIGEYLKILRTPRPYKSMNITSIVSLAKSQRHL
ncbi:hypothetical protein [Nostoc sp. S13]|uniref:hypothetical protein n=1 Tax=Nostoc sp. S13 TaxID=3019266 RepID=UPI00261EDAED|nr:hypothetical protein [Nostoc sp. S13]MDF5738252.1 hypothetical protein [Nostoc sp. S13]